MKKILVLFAHPAYHKSKINRALRAAAEGLEGITFHDLYAAYPDFLIDVKREQALCVEHDVIVFQHPLFWYSAPAIIKEWQDLVLEYGWAYGHEGNTLRGKLFFQAFTAGGGAEAYCPGGLNHYTITELTTPFRATANLCGLQWLPPFAVLGVHRGISDVEMTRHGEDYRRLLIGIRDETHNLEALATQQRLNPPAVQED